MPTAEDDFLGAVEVHSVDGLAAVLDAGLDVRASIRGKSLINWLTEMYLRSNRFADCLRLLLDRGAVLDDPAIAPVLIDDADGVRANPSLVTHRMTLVSAFTPLDGATMLHVAAEYGNANAAQALIEAGAEVNATAAVDEFGLNGQTPLFHTVNSILNYSEPILRLLLDAGAKVDVRLAGIVWGRGFEWETTLFDVTPISYAQFGLLPQVHRKEREIYEIARRLLDASNRQIPPLDNVPNRYLRPKTIA
jgi:ankyrin repeat protein